MPCGFDATRGSGPSLISFLYFYLYLPISINTATIPLVTEPLSPIPWSRFSGTFHASPIDFYITWLLNIYDSLARYALWLRRNSRERSEFDIISLPLSLLSTHPYEHGNDSVFNRAVEPDSQGKGLTEPSGSPLEVPCAPKYFSGRFSYSTCTNDFGAATLNERRFQFRLGQSRVLSSSVIALLRHYSRFANQFLIYNLLAR